MGMSLYKYNRTQCKRDPPDKNQSARSDIQIHLHVPIVV